MTTERVYRCNLCRDEIRSYALAEGPKEGCEGVGIHYGTNNSTSLKFVHMRNAEHHLCMRCAETVHVRFVDAFGDIPAQPAHTEER